MESSRQKKCPVCFSENVSDTGKREKSENNMSFGDTFGFIPVPIYRCHKCDKLFMYINNYEETSHYNSDEFGGGMPF